MKVRMVAQISGTRDGRDWPAPGGVIDLPEDEANTLIGHAMAEVPDEAATVVPDEVERAVAPRARFRPS